jgi:hypothetical protein
MEINPVDRLLMDKCRNPKALFVFPTDVAMNRWVDRLLRLQGGSVAMEQFTAWDTFKQESIRSRMQDKKSVPALLRKIFTERLIGENADGVKSGGPAIFRSLIPPEYASSASSFAPWLSSVLPQLGSWFEKVSGRPIESITGEDSSAPAFADGDDRDLSVLAFRYKQFLDENGLFEPAWEKPPFEDNGRECFIFFPESLSDYSEYKGLLEKAEHVRIVPLEESGAAERPFKTYFHTNARSEITEAALYIRNLAEKGIPWDSIVVCVPDTENYEPYVLREFANRNIPAVRRSGKALSAYPAGRLFSALADCHGRNFAFDAVSNLLLNSHLPWKNREIIDRLVDFGIKNNCLCSWIEGGKKEDVWLDAFSSLSGRGETLAYNYYRDLKTTVEKLCGAPSFADIIRQYFMFRERFLNIAECSPESDTVLSRCVSELLRLAEIEGSFPGITAPDPYRFFVEHLDETSYLPQENSRGISILPYRTAAPAPFDCHIVLGASQDNLSEVFSRLAFLPRLKKEKLGLKDIDASKVFIELHKLNSEMPAVFFCAQESFSGFAIPHAGLEQSGKARMRYGDSEAASFAPDLFDLERRFLSDTTALPVLYEIQAAGFLSFFERRHASLQDRSGEALRHGGVSPVLAALAQKRYSSGGDPRGKLRVSATAMEPYFRCAAEWLYANILRLESVRMETALMAENIMGSLYHAILNRFFNSLEAGFRETGFWEAGGILAPPDGETLPAPYQRLLASSAAEVFGGLPLLPGESRPLSALTVRFLKAGEQAAIKQTELLLAVLLRYFAGFRIGGSEIGYRAEEENYYLIGKVDLLLIDERDESDSPGAAVIVDFKLNYFPRRGDCIGTGERGLGNFQLPMYITLTEANGGPPVHTALFFKILKAAPQVIFGSIKDRIDGTEKPGRHSAAILREQDKFAAILAEFREKAGQYAGEVQAGDFSVFSTGEKQCAKCGYHRICRTLYTVERDRDLIRREAANG